MSTMTTALGDCADFYRDGASRLLGAGIPFMVGGTYALEVHCGIVRSTKDFDLFLERRQVGPVLALFERAGYRTEVPYPHWLVKAYRGDEFIDFIFNAGNGVCPVDETWLKHATHADVLGLSLPICPVEETIWQKAYILDRGRCDVADVAHLIRHQGAKLDWKRLIGRFGPRWRVLLAQLTLYEFIYPQEREAVPLWVMDELWQRRATEPPVPRTAEPECHGTLLSVSQYLQDVEGEGLADARLRPRGPLTPAEVEAWTAPFR